MYRMIHNVHISLVFLGFVVVYIHKHQQSKKQTHEAVRRVGIQSSNASCLQEAECTSKSFFAQKRHSRYEKTKTCYIFWMHVLSSLLGWGQMFFGEEKKRGWMEPEIYDRRLNKIDRT